MRLGIKRFLMLFSMIAGSVNAAPPEQYVVLISLDGFRHDYIEKHEARHLAAIAKQGTRVMSMTPVYPANTFPNHLSLITGLRPAHHGIINNRFYDKARRDYYKMGKGYQDSSWITAVPLWNLAEVHGVKAATFFWPESDARIGGQLPSYHYHYSKQADYQQRVDQILAWLAYPEAARPHFIAGYFSLVDTVGHNYGPDAEETFMAVQQLDALIGQLYQRLQALPLQVNLVLVSDHGMTNVEPSRRTDISALQISQDFIVMNEGEQILLYANEGVTADSIEAQRDSINALGLPGVQVLTNEQRQHYFMPANSRTGDLIITIAPPGSFVNNKDDLIEPGGHGYLPEHPDMGAFFVAAGPAFNAGVTLPSMNNLAVYPAIAKIMGLPLLSPIDGNLSVISPALKTK